MNTFDPDAFMETQIDQPLEFEKKLVPAAEYSMIIDDFDSKAFRTSDFEYQKGPKAGQPGSMTVFNIPCVVQDDKVNALMNRDKVIVYKECILEFQDDGQLAWGVNQNTDLGAVRNAVGQNAAGTVWKPGNLRGAGPFMGKVEHQTVTKKDGTKTVIAKVTRVAPIR